MGFNYFLTSNAGALDLNWFYSRFFIVVGIIVIGVDGLDRVIGVIVYFSNPFL